MESLQYDQWLKGLNVIVIPDPWHFTHVNFRRYFTVWMFEDRDTLQWMYTSISLYANYSPPTNFHSILFPSLSYLVDQYEYSMSFYVWIQNLVYRFKNLITILSSFPFHREIFSHVTFYTPFTVEGVQINEIPFHPSLSIYLRNIFCTVLRCIRNDT